ncbi:MAG: hypothetical protein HOD72_00800 [Opitutae bacterium]|nr:hypothetical protein [Opitutae bacterium]MBT4222980.1 hypothetical protein [Opitutae bacterium]MBT5690790.1 hypothetical protein [Opitutae bacterium]MBT6463763.1 hypothetical protein [Opitutae bacterium]MBT6958012.1 hypothetical protein [Opitutae bacterium]
MAQTSTPTANISTAIILLLAIIVLWLLLKVFIKIVLLIMSLAVSGITAAISYRPTTPYVEFLYRNLFQLNHTEREGAFPFIKNIPDPQIVAFAAVFITTFILTSLLLATIFRKTS